MTPEQLQQIKERAERATLGPWVAAQKLDSENNPIWDFNVIVGDNREGGHQDPATGLVTNGIDICRRLDGPTAKINANFIAHSREDIPALLAEVERLTTWTNDLQSGMYINCVYCGHRYGPKEDTPASMADILKLHVEQCPAHPMSMLKAENERLTAENVRLKNKAGEIPEDEKPDLSNPINYLMRRYKGNRIREWRQLYICWSVI